MDDSNQHLQYLILQTDIAFKALLEEPSSVELNQAYDSAKYALDDYVAALKNALHQRKQVHQRHEN